MVETIAGESFVADVTELRRLHPGLLTLSAWATRSATRREDLMTDMTLQDLAKAMGKIDFAMLTTRTEGGQLATRPMSNNGEVEWQGDSYYFSYDDARTVSDILSDPHVALSFQGRSGLLGKPPLFVAVEGAGKTVRDKQAFAEHWTPDLERWFPQGVDTPGLVMIEVNAVRVHYWDGTDEGEVAV